MTDKPTNFITRHVATLRELAASMSEAPGLAEILGKSANIIEQVVDGNAAVRAEHVRVRTELEVQIGALEAQLTAAHQHIAALTSSTAITPTARTPPTQTWHALPCDPDDLNALIQLMPGGWVEIEWEEESSAFVIMNTWGVTPAVLEDYDWQEFTIANPGPGLHPKRPEECFEAWPHGRRCFAEYSDVDGEFRLLAINDLLVYSDPEGTPAPATFFMCTACEANLGAADPEPHDHCPICHKDGTLLLMREDGVRVP